MADCISAGLQHVARLPHSGELTEEAEPAGTGEPALPPWLPPGRTIGGFYLVRTIGTGAGGSVFVASRAEERHEDNPELFALKVPDYDGGAARSLSEEEFERLFMEEAAALLQLPRHTNIAQFVTFDARARPKPILVMELVQGPSLENTLQTSSLSMPAALDIIDGIAAGLAAMHEQRVAHLDIKPANIILRDAPRPIEAPRLTDTLRPGQVPLAAAPPVPVLVDFGLAGRKLRPGCGSPHYGAPEVWSPKLAETNPDPFAADVYAFACLVFELLTGQVLVTAESMIAVVAQHLSGQAGRKPLAKLAETKGLAPLAETLVTALNKDAARRPKMADLRKRVKDLAPALGNRRWPLPA
jgi:serine/threonine protein kinase